MHDLGTLGGDSSYALGIGETGDIVGWSDTASGGSHAFLYHGTMHDLGTLGGDCSYATGINDSGEAVGYSDTCGGESHAFLATPSPSPPA